MSPVLRAGPAEHAAGWSTACSNLGETEPAMSANSGSTLWIRPTQGRPMQGEARADSVGLQGAPRTRTVWRQRVARR